MAQKTPKETFDAAEQKALEAVGEKAPADDATTTGSDTGTTDTGKTTEDKSASTGDTVKLDVLGVEKEMSIEEAREKAQKFEGIQASLTKKGQELAREKEEIEAYKRDLEAWQRELEQQQIDVKTQVEQALAAQEEKRASQLQTQAERDKLAQLRLEDPDRYAEIMQERMDQRQANLEKQIAALADSTKQFNEFVKKYEEKNKADEFDQRISRIKQAAEKHGVPMSHVAGEMVLRPPGADPEQVAIELKTALKERVDKEIEERKRAASTNTQATRRLPGNLKAGTPISAAKGEKLPNMWEDTDEFNEMLVNMIEAAEGKP